MSRLVLFIQGGGNGGYEEDAKLVASLRKALGKAYKVLYPKMLPDETEPDFGGRWLKQNGQRDFFDQRRSYFGRPLSWCFNVA